jgi:hypothetical protein
LRYFYPLTLVRRKTKTISPNHRTGVNNRIFAQFAVGINRHIGIKHTAVTNPDTITQHATGVNDNAVTKLHTQTDADIRPNANARRQLGSARRSRVNARNNGNTGIKQRRQAGVISIRIAGHDTRQGQYIGKIRGNDDGRCARRL